MHSRLPFFYNSSVVMSRAGRASRSYGFTDHMESRLCPADTGMKGFTGPPSGLNSLPACKERREINTGRRAAREVLPT